MIELDKGDFMDLYSKTDNSLEELKVIELAILYDINTNLTSIESMIRQYVLKH